MTTKTEDLDFGSGISRRSFMALGGGVAASLLSSQIEAGAQAGEAPIPGPPGQVVKYPKTALWVQLTTGGKSYPASLQEMFLDPMFLRPAMVTAIRPSHGLACIPKRELFVSRWGPRARDIMTGLSACWYAIRFCGLRDDYECRGLCMGKSAAA
jgi:hypothetical protein